MDRIKATKYGLRHHSLYRMWTNMKQRCSNKNRTDYKYYGGKGVIVCAEWKDNSKSFVKWALDNGWKKGLYLDRIKNDGHYTPDNCRFVDKWISARNTQLLRSTNTSGYRGVWIDKKAKSNKYRAEIFASGIKKHLGSFPSARLAALRYDAEAYLLNDGRPRNLF